MQHLLQGVLDLFGPNEQTVHAVHRIARKKVARPTSPLAQALTPEVWQQLDLMEPLLADRGDIAMLHAELVQPRAVRVAPVEVQRAQSAAEADSFPIERAALWMAKVLYRQLELLLWSRDGTGDQRSDILAWIFATGYAWVLPDEADAREDASSAKVSPKQAKQFVGPPRPVLAWTHGPPNTVNDRKKPPPDLSRVPFSFEACCLVEEIPAQALRDAIADRLSQIQKAGPGAHRIRAALH